MKPLETPRLLLRPFTLEDAEAVHREIYRKMSARSTSNGGSAFVSNIVSILIPQGM